MLVNFVIISCIGALLIFSTWLFTYEILGKVWALLLKLRYAPRLRVLMIGVPIFIVHIVNIWIYAGVYFAIENLTNFGHIEGAVTGKGLTLANFFDCLYFSAITYTSLGLGDLVPTLQLRMLASAEVLNGLLMIGWTISFTYLTMEKFWSQPNRHHLKSTP